MAKSQVIRIQGARMHNLKNITVEIPRGSLTVVTGVSGSGKSSLVFDTLYAEGHRRYVESLSSYARQFLSRMQKPDVDQIIGLSPAIAIEQRGRSANPLSTVGTITEINDYLKLLFARAGITYSPISNQPVKCDTVTDIVNYITQQAAGSRLVLSTLITVTPQRSYEQELQITLQKGFSRILKQGQPVAIEDEIEQLKLNTDLSAENNTQKNITKTGKTKTKVPKISTIELLIDRFVIADQITEEFQHRVADSVQTALNEGGGICQIYVNEGAPRVFSERFELDGMTFEHPTPAFFDFNNPFGACPVCEGSGKVQGFDMNKVIYNPGLSVNQGVVLLWQTDENTKSFLTDFQQHNPNFPLDKPFEELTEAEKEILFYSDYGVITRLKELTKKLGKAGAAQLLYYKGIMPCPDCRGSRLRKDAHYVRVGDYSLPQLWKISLAQLSEIFDKIELSDYQLAIADRLLLEIRSRLAYLCQVGLGYLTLNRVAGSLSGGEMQRIQLANSLGSTLTGSLYILDEPSVGLHPRDGNRLITVLESLKKLGNTVIVVEHDEAVMQRADYLIDVGPLAGESGGKIVFSGTYTELMSDSDTCNDSLTRQYLKGQKTIPIPNRRTPQSFITLSGARLHNLKNITVNFPLNVLTVITGVSGSGKTTLVKQLLYPLLIEATQSFEANYYKPPVGSADKLKAVPKTITGVELIDQNALQRNERSNATTYVGAYDGIRELFSEQSSAKERGLRSFHFSFNVEGGRCEMCQGEGMMTIPMQFLPDVRLTCESCNGKRFKSIVLEVTYQGLNIFEVLNLTAEAAMAFFKDHKKITNKLKPLIDVGLGYIRLGQSTSTLSGGEAQRLKLASFLANTNSRQGNKIYIFDEPTTGLHFQDVYQLLKALQQLVENGHTVIVIEHHLDVIKCADWLIDLGPEGGDGGGQLVYAGPPEGIIAVPSSFTGKYLIDKLIPKKQVTA